MGFRREGGCRPRAVSDLNSYTYRKLEPLEAGALVIPALGWPERVMWLRQRGGGLDQPRLEEGPAVRGGTPTPLPVVTEGGQNDHYHGLGFFSGLCCLLS